VISQGTVSCFSPLDSSAVINRAALQGTQGGAWWLTFAQVRGERSALSPPEPIARHPLWCAEANTRPSKRQSAFESCPHHRSPISSAFLLQSVQSSVNCQRLRTVKRLDILFCHLKLPSSSAFLCSFALLVRDITILARNQSLRCSRLTLAGWLWRDPDFSLVECFAGHKLQGMRETSLDHQH
jgi:hypothetical protein